MRGESPAALASRRRRPLFGLLQRGHRRRSNTVSNDLPYTNVQRSPPHRTLGHSYAPNTPNLLMTTASHTAADPSLPPGPPTKASLKTWWNHFTFAQRAKKEAEEKKGKQFILLCPFFSCSILLTTINTCNLAGENVVFGKPLKESLKYASVQISTANANGELYVWGYIPVVVAKWCVILVLSYPLCVWLTREQWSVPQRERYESLPFSPLRSIGELILMQQRKLREHFE